MRLENIPILLGVLVILAALGIIYDAVSPPVKWVLRERRRRRRAEINTPGEILVGIGTACLGLALIGRDAWRWTTIVVITGVVLVAIGALMNRSYLREMLLFRGAARRTGEMEVPPIAKKESEPRLRIR